MCKISLLITITLIDFASTASHSNDNRIAKLQRHERRRQLLEISGPEATEVKEYWFDQYLDHFDPTEARIWQQRYFLNNSLEKKDGPIFLSIGGEGTANPKWMSNGAWIDYAKELGARLYLLEHRYYGKSHPTADLSVKNLVYLSSQQALADLANFIETISLRHELGNRKWILFGGSYPGSLAAWFRLKYPHLCHGSVSVSGPMKAKMNFEEYLEVVSTSLDSVNTQCRPQLQKALKQVDLLTRHRVGWNTLTKDFKLCKPLSGSDALDVSNFVETLVGYFEDVVQYNRDNRGFEGNSHTDVTIDTLCDIITATNDKSELERLADVNSFMVKTFTNESCIDTSYSAMIDALASNKWSDAAAIGGRQWLYQTCTEFGWYQSSDQQGHPYTARFPVQFLEHQCSDVFGPKYDLGLLSRGVENTNRVYGGKHIEVNKVIFVNGNIDPWHAMGITNSSNKTGYEAVLIEDTAHCALLYPAANTDPRQLVQARQQVLKLIKEWIQ